MKAALVFPRTRYPTGDPPLGVAYLAAAMRERTGQAPAVIDTTFQSHPFKYIEQELSRERFDLVGISAMVTMAKDAMEAARIAKRMNPACMVVMGGPHPTTLPGEVLEEPAVDAVCMGEGERTFAELVERGEVAGVAGLFLRDNDNGVIRGEQREMINDLDELPFPALDLLPMEDYMRHWFQLDSIAPGIKGTSVLATRGCPFRCAYCQPVLDKLFGRGFRKRSPGNVVLELEQRKRWMGISGFVFADDTFVADRNWVKSFCLELESRGLNLIWGCNVRADLVDEDLLETMARAGLAKVYIGIEVYDDACRDRVFNKKLTREQVERAVEAARSLGIRTQGYFMLGAPGETRKDIWNTLRYSWRLPLEEATYNLTTPLPGTYLFNEHADKVSISADEMDYYRRYAFMPEQGKTGSWLKRMQVLAYLVFYLRPGRLFRLAADLFKKDGPERLGSKLRRVF